MCNRHRTGGLRIWGFGNLLMGTSAVHQLIAAPIPLSSVGPHTLLYLTFGHSEKIQIITNTLLPQPQNINSEDGHGRCSILRLLAAVISLFHHNKLWWLPGFITSISCVVTFYLCPQHPWKWGSLPSDRSQRAGCESAASTRWDTASNGICEWQTEGKSSWFLYIKNIEGTPSSTFWSINCFEVVTLGGQTSPVPAFLILLLDALVPLPDWEWQLFSPAQQYLLCCLRLEWARDTANDYLTAASYEIIKRNSAVWQSN